ncbi:MAG: recombination-associated protein RdgC [Myxococcota bacterium]|nr:recombination-associated protein RdgC [Myxococcota bacterium]
MGVFSGSLTFKQYTARDSIPDDWKTLYQKAIERYTFRPLDPASEAERAVGWCSPHFPLDLELDLSDLMYTDYLVLGMRIDTWNLPAATLKIYAEAEARRVMAEQQREALNRYERAEIKERIKLELKRKTLPSIKTIEMVWNWREGVIRLFSSSQKVNLEFVDLFEETFAVRLMPDGPLAAARSAAAGLSDDEQGQVLELEPCLFVDTNTAFEALSEI